MALFNVMVLDGNSYPVVAAIKDCTGHLSQAGKKDTLFIADVFTKLLLEFDAEKHRVDIFYFDGVSNVQKAGEVLGVKFPQTAQRTTMGSTSWLFGFLILPKFRRSRFVSLWSTYLVSIVFKIVLLPYFLFNFFCKCASCFPDTHF